jgi:hypothetical protein
MVPLPAADFALAFLALGICALALRLAGGVPLSFAKTIYRSLC